MTNLDSVVGRCRLVTEKLGPSSIIEWTPMPDISAFELAQAVPFLLGSLNANGKVAFDLVDRLPSIVRRHFTVREER